MALRVRKSRVEHPPEICPLTECMAIVGGAWTANVIWYLSAGPRRFGELRKDLPRISARVLSTRLRELEDQGVVEKRALETSPPTAEYTLTDLGQELIPAIVSIIEVGRKLKARRSLSHGDGEASELVEISNQEDSAHLAMWVEGE